MTRTPPPPQEKFIHGYTGSPINLKKTKALYSGLGNEREGRVAQLGKQTRGHIIPYTLFHLSLSFTDALPDVGLFMMS